MEDKSDEHTPMSTPSALAPVTDDIEQRLDKYGRPLFNKKGERKYDEKGRPLLGRSGISLTQDVIDQLPGGADDVVVSEFHISYKKINGLSRVITDRIKPGNLNAVLTDGCIAQIMAAIDDNE